MHLHPMPSERPTALQARAPDFSAREFRASLGMFATGVTIVTARTDSGELVGLTANSFNSVSLNPPLVLWSLGRSAGSMAAFSNGRHYAINVLAADQQALAEQFAAKDTDRWAGVAFREGGNGAPLLEGAAASFECFKPQPVRRRRPRDLCRRGRALQRTAPKLHRCCSTAGASTPNTRSERQRARATGR